MRKVPTSKEDFLGNPTFCVLDNKKQRQGGNVTVDRLLKVAYSFLGIINSSCFLKNSPHEALCLEEQ